MDSIWFPIIFHNCYHVTLMHILQKSVLQKIWSGPISFNLHWHHFKSLYLIEVWSFSHTYIHSALEKISDQKNPLDSSWCNFSTLTPYLVVPGQKWKNRTARLRDILPFTKAHALKRVVQLKVIKGKKIFLGRGSTLLLCKKFIC